MPEPIKVMQSELVCTNCKIKGRFRDCTICAPVFGDSEIIAAYEAAIEALKSKSEAEEYRTSKKVIKVSNDLYICPTCGLGPQKFYIPYCGNCGQALDWSEVEE